MKVFERCFLMYLLVGVPTLFAIIVLTEREEYIFISASLIAIHAAVIFLQGGLKVGSRIHSLYYTMFIVLGFATVLGIISGDTGLIRSQLISLTICFGWTSVFVATAYTVRSGIIFEYALGLLDILGILMAVSVALSFLGSQYLGFSFGEMVYHDGAIRMFGPFGDQVGFALEYFALRSLIFKKWIRLIIYCLTMLATGTRGVVISFLVGFIWIFFDLRRKVDVVKKDNVRLFVLSLLMTVTAVVFFLSPYGEGTLARFQDFEWGAGASEHRIDAAFLGLKIFADNPVIGVGYLGYNHMSSRYRFDTYFGLSTHSERATYTAQNQYVQIATDGGIMALAIFVIFLVTILRELEKAKRILHDERRLDFIAAAAWLIAIVLGNQAAVWFLPNNITSYLFFAVAGLFIGYSLLLSKEGILGVEKEHRK